MAFIEWDESFSVGIHCIDEQHVMLVDTINEFYDKIGKGERKENLLRLFQSLRIYTSVHFTDEEDYMQKFDFPGYLPHKAEHEAFLVKITSMEDRFNRGELILSFEVLTLMRQWLIEHMKGLDKEYSELFLSKGLM